MSTGSGLTEGVVVTRAVEGVDGRVQREGRVVVVVKGLAARGDVGEGQFRGRLPNSKSSELIDEALANAAGAWFITN